MSTADRLIPSREAAALCGLAPATLAAWRSRKFANQPPYVRLGKRAVRYRETAIREWIAQQETVAVRQ